MNSRYAEGARALAPIGIAAFGFSLSFGVLARAAGMGWAAPLVMSATTFAGSAQFAVASILKDGGAVAAAITAAVMLNARYAPMGIAVASSFEGSWLKRLFQSQLIVDESWAIALKRKGGFGLDAAFPALFLTLLVTQLTGRREIVAALLGGGIALALIPFTPPGVPIIAGAAACLVGWRAR